MWWMKQLPVNGRMPRFVLHTGIVTVSNVISVNKKLRRGTARRAMLVSSSCYVSRGMGVRKVQNTKRYLQGHSRALAMVPFDRLHMISYYSSIATLSLFCTVSEILSFISQKSKRSRLFWGQYIMLALVLLCINQHEKFQVPSFTDSTHMIGANFKITGHVTLTMPIRKFSVIRMLALDWRLSLQQLRYMIVGTAIENGLCDPDHAPFMGGLSSKSYDLILSTNVQNLTILVLAVLDKSLGPQNLKWVTWSWPRQF